LTINLIPGLPEEFFSNVHEACRFLDKDISTNSIEIDEEGLLDVVDLYETMTGQYRGLINISFLFDGAMKLNTVRISDLRAKWLSNNWSNRV
jgi:hypothetical protein